jgi:translation initiation factor IF-2
MPKKDEKSNIVPRAPVVVVMGHIDHGKSKLLDYIRKTNVVEGEAGGITQHISAYEVTHKDEKGEDRKITFLDTPGHEAFSKMRSRGAAAGDIAILVVSAEDSVKAQTVEALQTIKSSGIPYIVAINKIDKPGANPEKTKMDLAEKEVYLEGYGGQIPFVEISAKVGTGIGHLLDLILLVADLNEFKGDKSKKATGYVLESNLDPKRGISATLIVKDGSMKKGEFAVAGGALSAIRILENFLGRSIDQASFSSPVRITGWSSLPEVGQVFSIFESKKEAEAQALKNKGSQKEKKSNQPESSSSEAKMIPVIIKTDVSGSLEVIEKELGKLAKENIAFKIIQKGVGNINENDFKMSSSDKDSIILGFNVKADKNIPETNEKTGVQIRTFDTIYKMAEWLSEEVEKRRPRVEVEEVIGKAKIQKLFNQTKGKQIVGGKVYDGKLALGPVRILRRDFEIGRGNVAELQQNKAKTREVAMPNEFGAMIESKIEVAPGDILESLTVVTK